jgi:hypothetical protein
MRGPPYNYYYHHSEEGGGDEEYDHQQHTCMTWHALISMVLFLLCSLFSVLVIYALSTNNTEAVRNACPDLYTYMVTRTALGLCVFLALCGVSAVNNGAPSDSNRNVMLYFLCIYFVVLAVWGCVVVSRSMVNNEKCTDTLLDSTLKVPLMGDLGWIYVVCDILYCVGVLLAIIGSQFQQEAFHGM